MNAAEMDENRHADLLLEQLLGRIEEYYDAVPRSAARAEDFGTLTLFVRDGRGWPYYARPALGRTGDAVTTAEVERVRDRQRELGVPENFEWVAENSPHLRAAVEESGLVVHEHPLLALDLSRGRAAEEEGTGAASGAAGAAGTGAAGGAGEAVSVRVIEDGDPALPYAVAVPYVAFAQPDTQVGAAGTRELAEVARQLAEDGSVDVVAERIRDGYTAVAVAEEDGVALCAGQHQPVGAVSEIVGVGTLPSARRRGLGLAVTAALVADARERGVRTVFLSANNDDVARIYERLGFRRVATALIAEPVETAGAGETGEAVEAEEPAE
ncbi:GNAT family N-acetyltransferase [Streptomyces chrestomyceticus]|uniref:GNAT family N-acetyltransferase n=1 Tax=Streptomyces chrestomyceticus TaxID=68185 RepID=UPI0036940885